MLIEPATPADVASIASIHRNALPDDVLPSLGTAFLHDFYSWVLTQPDQHLTVARDDEGVQGFCLLSLRPISVIRVLRARHLVAVAKVAIGGPRRIASAVKQAMKPTVSDWSITAEIAFIAVEPTATGQGIGRRMMDEAASVTRDHDRAHVATKTANAGLARYYVRAFGATVTKTFRAGGRDYSVLEWTA